MSSVAKLPENLLNARRPAVATSGGVDSVLLLHLLVEAFAQRNLKPAVLHVDHGLRSTSANDATFVADLAKKLGCTFYIHEVVGLAPGPGLENRARDVRYNALRNWADTLQLDAIYLGHHEDDQAETIAMRILRGAGVRGLLGIPEQRSLTERCTIRRPLLGWSREEIVRLAEARDLKWREDDSNQDWSHLRNRLRLDVLRGAPKLRDRLLTVRRGAQELERRLVLYSRDAAPKLLQHFGSNWVALSKAAAADVPEHFLADVIRHVLEPFPDLKAVTRQRLSLTRLCQALLEVRGVPSPFHGPGRMRIIADQKHVGLMSEERPLSPVESHSFKCQQLGSSDAIEAAVAQAREDPTLAVVALEKVSGEPRLGHLDAKGYQPLGAASPRPRKKLVAHPDIPRVVRTVWPCVRDDHQVLWVPPHGPAAPLATDAKTREAWLLRWERRQPRPSL